MPCHAMPGLVGEADDVSHLGYMQPKSNLIWLAWETKAEIEPVQRMPDTFGVGAIEATRQQSCRVRHDRLRTLTACSIIAWRNRLVSLKRGSLHDVARGRRSRSG